MTCAELRRVLPRFEALELPAADEARVRRHLEQCERCASMAVEREPARMFAMALADVGAMEDDRFVADVMTGIRLRRVERRAGRHRRGWLAAAAALIVVAAAALFTVSESTPPALRAAGSETPVTRAVVADRVAGGSALAAAEPPSVEVEGEGVRLYQLGTDGVQVAFIVDPSLEL